MHAIMSGQFGDLAQFLPMAGADRLALSEALEKTPSSTYKVLIMEGNVPLARLLATGLSSEMPVVHVTHGLESAMSQLATSAYDLLILDLDLPDMDGLKLLTDLRANKPDARILALSGRAGTDALVAALDNGADDYLQKPFSLLEMMARVRALRRRSQTGFDRSVKPKSESLILNREQCQVQRDGRTIDLTPREFTLLEYLMQNPGKTLSRAILTQEVWNMSPETNTNIVDVYIKYLRDKIDGDNEVKLIRTVRGTGYLFQANA